MSDKLSADQNLVVDFYIGDDGDEWVKIITTGDNSEYHARAASMSFRDPRTNDDISYAQRFAARYAGFLATKGKAVDDKRASLEAQLAALDAQPDVSDAALKKAEDTAREKAEEYAADHDPARVTSRIAAAALGTTPAYASMSDDDLRDFISEKAGKPVPGTVTKRETLLRMAEEVTGA